MTKTVYLHRTFAALLIISAIGITTSMADSNPEKAIPTDDYKPPVFAFAPKTEIRALAVVEPPVQVWTDDFRPAPKSFYRHNAEDAPEVTSAVAN